MYHGAHMGPTQIFLARSKTRARFLLVAVLSFTVGCQKFVGVTRVSPEAAYRQVNANAIEDAVLSSSSREVLRRHDLYGAFLGNPASALETFHPIVCLDMDREYLFAAAEVAYLAGRARNEPWFYLASAVYAYVYLFEGTPESTVNVYDPQLRIASELYNRSLEEFLQPAIREGVRPEGGHKLPFGSMDIRVDRSGFPLSREEFHEFLPADRFKVQGLASRHRLHGLGVPFIAVRKEEKGERKPGDYLAPRAKVGSTVFLRIPDARQGLRSGKLRGNLELYATFRTTEIEVEGRRVPLEADLTAPLAYQLDTVSLFDMEIGGFLRTDEQVTGLIMLEPYTPGKIPVVFVHGTASSPARWAEMFNGLNGYKDLRDRFQFWFFRYTTGNPIVYSAHLLRTALVDALKTLDPEGKDAALREMVVIGHSQGGILTRMLTVTSGDAFWMKFSKKKIEDLDVSPETRELLRDSLIFERAPFVRRVIFIATPHKGSFMAATTMGSIAASFVSLPRNLARVSTELFTKNQAAIALSGVTDVPTSIMNMDPDNPFLKTLDGFPLPPDVKGHTIIAVKPGEEPLERGSDGVVEYTSARLDGVESQFILRWNHSCQAHPRTIGEVRRILRAHLAGLQAEAQGAVPPGTATP